MNKLFISEHKRYSVCHAANGRWHKVMYNNNWIYIVSNSASRQIPRTIDTLAKPLEIAGSLLSPFCSLSQSGGKELLR